jgi:hypothetical protein
MRCCACRIILQKQIGSSWPLLVFLAGFTLHGHDWQGSIQALVPEVYLISDTELAERLEVSTRTEPDTRKANTPREPNRWSILS